MRVTSKLVVIFFLASTSILIAVVKSSSASQPPDSSDITRYDYTYIVDQGVPEIGENGDLEYDEKWRSLLAKGWRLHSFDEKIWIFERRRN